MMNISILEKTKNYVIVKIPRRFIDKIELPIQDLTEEQALQILRAGMEEYKEGKTNILTSLRDLRYGN